MAWGPNAQVVPCIYCAEAADRVTEGEFVDIFRCRACGREYGAEFVADTQPSGAMWPLTPEQHATIQKDGELMLRRHGEFRPSRVMQTARFRRCMIVLGFRIGRVDCPACGEDMVPTGRTQHSDVLGTDLWIWRCPVCDNTGATSRQGRRR